MVFEVIKDLFKFGSSDFAIADDDAGDVVVEDSDENKAIFS